MQKIQLTSVPAPAVKPVAPYDTSHSDAPFGSVQETSAVVPLVAVAVNAVTAKHVGVSSIETSSIRTLSV